MAIDWAAIRDEFPPLREWTFLNTATFGQMPRRAVEAMERHFTHRDELACWDFLDWFDDADEIRRSIAQLVNCQGEDVAFIPHASTGLSLLLGGLEWKAGDRVVTFQNEFPNNLYFPSLLGERGVEFVETDWDGLPNALNERTRVVVASTVNYTNGYRPPLEELSRLTRERGILLYLDGTQSVGALQIDLSKIRPSLFTVHGYKWLLAPTGAAFMYVSPELRQRLKPNVVGWRSDYDWHNVSNLHHGAPRFSGDAERYEGGMLPFPLLYAMGASVRMMLELGPAAIEERVQELAAGCRRVVRSLGGKLLYDERPNFDSGIVAARFEGYDASELARRLKERNVLVSARHGNVRVSVHFYNSQEDLDRLGNELGRLV
jgi:cysteine desulfurase / selenocysteine lyase